MEYLGRGKMVLSSHVVSINFANPANMRKVHKELLSQVRTSAIYISNKYRVQTEPLQFKWGRFLPTLDKDFPEIIKC